MRRKFAQVLLVLLPLLLFTGILYAVYVIVSPTVSVTVSEYTLTLNQNATSCNVDEAILFSGALTVDGSPISGELVTLYYSNDTTTGLSDVTGGDGSYSMIWTATEKGTFDFYAKSEI